MLLLTVYTSFYLDDENKPQRVLVHGRTGKMSGLRRASMQRGQRTSMILLGVAVLVFLLSLVLAGLSLLAPPLLAVGVLGFVAALLFGLGAIGPVATVWWFNRNRGGRQI